MKITCEQMDILVAFYIEDSLSNNLRKDVEEHLENCPICKNKYDLIRSLFTDMRGVAVQEKMTDSAASIRDKAFVNNLSAYVDNELPQEENIKIKKYTICNKKARKELEEMYHIRKLMNESFKKTKNTSNKDYSRTVLKNINLISQDSLSFSPLIKIGFAFIFTVLAISAIVLYILSI